MVNSSSALGVHEGRGSVRMPVFCESDASCRTRPEEAGEKLYRKGDTFSVDFDRKGECKLNKKR